MVDQQFDFEPHGALPVRGGDEIVSGIAEKMETFETVIVTQDSHPSGHISFASSYEGKKAFDLLTIDDLNTVSIKSQFSVDEVRQYLISLESKTQVLWPDHCVIGTRGWQLNSDLPLHRASVILRKGTRQLCDSYSAFFENDRNSTGLAECLRARSIEKVVVVGLAGDYCVAWSALDAVRLGFKVEVPISLTRFVDFPTGSKESSLQRMRSAGVLIS